MYELVSNNTSPSYGSSSPVHGGGIPTGQSGEVETKVDSEGRVWVRVPLMVGVGGGGGSTSPTVGAAGGRYPGGGGGYEPVTPASTLGTGNGTAAVVEPQELAGSERRDGEVEWPRHQTYYHA